GAVFGILFFVLLSFAAWTSALSLIEPAVAWMVERFNKTRAQAAVIVGFAIWLLGMGTVLSYNVLADVRFLAGTIYDNVDYLASNIMLPLGGLLIAIFAGWVMCRNSSADELGGAGFTYRAWRLLARFVAPVGILIIFVNTVWPAIEDALGV
ncbi:MAG: sodium-dependent transporter, partial [Woeseiaceae bacterium]|nr:sodium-dependent transporter [Woeseiaceae bacterium]